MLGVAIAKSQQIGERRFDRGAPPAGLIECRCRVLISSRNCGCMSGSRLLLVVFMVHVSLSQKVFAMSVMSSRSPLREGKLGGMAAAAGFFAGVLDTSTGSGSRLGVPGIQ